jgi:DNA-binding response OmpR family regulator
MEDRNIPMEKFKKRILCVEDDADTCLLITLMLPAYDVVTVSNLREAVQLIEKESFDLYLLDNWLGGDSGIQLCQYIQTADPNTPVIFCSGAVYERDREEALQAGAQDYLLKPVEPSVLQKAVEQQIHKSEKRCLESRVDELFAVHDTIKELLANTEEKLNGINERIARVKAFKAFIAAGGNRTNFERLWHETWQEATQNMQQ